jgi:hypothetical protein
MSSETQKQNNDQQKIVAGFQKLREQQQTTVAEVGRIQTELREHTYI